MSKEPSQESRAKQFIVGGSLIVMVLGGFMLGLLFWRQIPGFLGESIGKIVGLLSTPFFLESSFVIFGFLIVIGLNSWRKYREGDEFVSLDRFEKNNQKAPNSSPHSEKDS